MSPTYLSCVPEDADAKNYRLYGSKLTFSQAISFPLVVKITVNGRSILRTVVHVKKVTTLITEYKKCRMGD